MKLENGSRKTVIKANKICITKMDLVNICITKMDPVITCPQIKLANITCPQIKLANYMHTTKMDLRIF